MLQASKSKTVSATQTNPTTTNERTSEGNDVQQSIPSDPSMSETEDSEEVFSPNFPACSACDCVIAELKRATSTTMTPVPDSMELIESCDSGSTTPTKNHHDKERDDSDGEYESSDNFDELATDVDWVQCAGLMGSLISQMMDLKQNIETCIAPNHKSFIIEAKEAEIACKKMAIRLKNSVDLALEKYKEGEVPATECDLPDPVSKDPGLRPPITTERQRLYLAQIGPQQPKLFNYPQNEDITLSSKQNRFTAVWFSQYPFLEYSIEKDAAFCYVCQMFPTGIDRERSTQNWSSTGVRTWDKMKSRGSGNPGKLSEHFSSKAHNAAFRDYVNFMSNNSHADSLLDTEVRAKAVQLQEDKENNRAIIKLIIDLCRTMARQGISFRGTQSDADSNFAQLLSFTSRHCPKLKQWINDKHNRAYKVTYTSPQSQNEFLSLLAMEVKEKIVTDIKDAGVFSIMADTTPDVSHKGQMSVICRYVDQDGAVYERLLDLKEVREKTGHGQATAIIQSVDQNGLDNKSIAFQSYDFTNICRENTMVHKQLSLGYLTEKYHTYHAKAIVQILSMNTLVKLVQ